MRAVPPHAPWRLASHILAMLVTGWATTAVSGLPVPAVLTGVEMQGDGAEDSTVVLSINGSVDRVDTIRLDGGRFVFDLTPVVWDGATRRTRPDSGGIREYRFSQYSRDPRTLRLVVEVEAGWSCRHDLMAGGLVVRCAGPPGAVPRRLTTGGSTIAVVRGVELGSPLAGLDAERLVDRSLGFTPRDLVRDGLPHFGSLRDDWKGSPRPHEGIDVYIDHITVLAVAAGTVVGVGRGDRAGAWIRIDHGNGVESVYVHVAGTRVSVGEHVRRGQPIAAIDGAVGNAVEPQLHFELRLDGESVDPVPFIFAIASDGLRRTIGLDYERLEILTRERETLISESSTSD